MLDRVLRDLKPETAGNHLSMWLDSDVEGLGANVAKEFGNKDYFGSVGWPQLVNGNSPYVLGCLGGVLGFGSTGVEHLEFSC